MQNTACHRHASCPGSKDPQLLERGDHRQSPPKYCLSNPERHQYLYDGDGIGNLSINSSILGTRSRILNGFETTSSYIKVSQEPFVNMNISALTIPASSAVCTCSARAFAVTAIIGTWPVSIPSFSISRIFRVHVRPSMTGIS